MMEPEPRSGSGALWLSGGIALVFALMLLIFGLALGLTVVLLAEADGVALALIGLAALVWVWGVLWLARFGAASILEGPDLAAGAVTMVALLGDVLLWLLRADALPSGGPHKVSWSIEVAAAQGERVWRPVHPLAVAAQGEG